MSIDMMRFTPRQPKTPAISLETIFVARLTEKRGLYVTTEACRQLKEQGVSFRYRILGIGPQERCLRTLIEQYQLDDVIEIPGFKLSHQIKEMSEQADVFLLPSITGRDGDMEGTSVALMEAMAVGIPVISTVHSGIPELIESGKSGWLASGNDTRTLAERLVAFSLLDSKQIQPIVQCVHEKVETEFNQLAIDKQLASLSQKM